MLLYLMDKMSYNPANLSLVLQMLHMPIQPGTCMEAPADLLEPIEPEERQQSEAASVTSSMRRSGDSSKGTDGSGRSILSERVTSSEDRQEKLLQILQSPGTTPNVPFPERLKFGEFLGHAFQRLPAPIYHTLRKQVFMSLCNAEDELLSQHPPPHDHPAPTPGFCRPAVPPPSSGPYQWPHGEQQQWQPPPSQWHSRPVSKVSVWQSQDAAWMGQQYPGCQPSPSQPDLARRHRDESSAADYVNSRDSSFNLSDYVRTPAYASQIEKDPTPVKDGAALDPDMESDV
jgi:hypothetical protein